MQSQLPKIAHKNQGIPIALLCNQIACIPHRAHPLAVIKFTLEMERNTWQWLLGGIHKGRMDYMNWRWHTRYIAHLNTDKNSSSRIWIYSYEYWRKGPLILLTNSLVFEFLPGQPWTKVQFLRAKNLLQMKHYSTWRVWGRISQGNQAFKGWIRAIFWEVVQTKLLKME